MMADLMMGAWPVWHWITFALVVALILHPTDRRLRRIGFSPFWGE